MKRPRNVERFLTIASVILWIVFTIAIIVYAKLRPEVRDSIVLDTGDARVLSARIVVNDVSLSTQLEPHSVTADFSAGGDLGVMIEATTDRGHIRCEAYVGAAERQVVERFTLQDGRCQRSPSKSRY
jgi:hypothetical protein